MFSRIALCICYAMSRPDAAYGAARSQALRSSRGSSYGMVRCVHYHHMHFLHNVRPGFVRSGFRDFVRSENARSVCDPKHLLHEARSSNAFCV
eukprot:2274022-Rhodomonas_salina.7